MSSPDSDAPKTRADEIKRWMRDIDTAQKREREYRSEGKRIVEIYEGKRKGEIPFNILYSNTSILSPALYGQTPRPIVQRRFKDDDPLGKAVSEASKRMLSYLLDTNSEEYDDFDSAMEETVLDGCLPGRGVLEFCYKGETAQVPGPAGPDGKPTLSEQLVHECIYAEHAIWNRYIFGYAKKWQDVPWLAFELYFDLAEATAEFGAPAAAKLKYVAEGDSEKDDKDTSEKDSDRKVARVYKIWDKKTKRLLFVSSGLDDYLKEEDDPYGLTGFFPVPKPLRLVPKSGNLLPTALYQLYENQATELNVLTLRINALIKGCKIRGVYDATLGDIEKALQSEDLDLTPTDQASTLAREGGLDKHIWLMPIDKIIGVIQQLYVSREQCKSVIYEITGISDIMRGDTQASETLGAQQLKSQYGSLRLKDLQKEVERYARDSLRIMLEIAASMFSPETWMKATGLPYLTDEQAVQAMQAQALAAQAAMSQGQPAPAAPPLSPKWSDVLAVLRDNLQREYKVDVETNSTIDPDASEAKKDLAELMNALAQFLNGVGPLVLEGALPLDAAKAMMLTVVRKFEAGDEIEDYIRQMQMPAKPAEQDKSGEIKLQGQLQSEQLKTQGLEQEKGLLQKEIALNARDADLRTREASLQAKEELFRIQSGAAKSVAESDHKNKMTQGKQLLDGAVGKVQQLYKEIEMKLKADAQSRATEKAASEKVQGERDRSSTQSADLVGLLKSLHTAIEGLTKASLAESVPDRDPKTNRITRVRKVIQNVKS